MSEITEQKFEETKNRLLQTMLDYRTRSSKVGEKIAYEEVQLRRAELLKHGDSKHKIFLPCDLLGHDFYLTQFCNRCNISSERLMKK